MTEENNQFVKGFFFNLPNENAPDYAKGKISIKKAEFVEYMMLQEGEWVNIDLLVSREGKPYPKLNTWKPEPR